MMGRSHALSAAVGWLAGCAALTSLGVSVDSTAIGAGMVVSTGFALLPDLDHPGSTVSRTLGPVTRGMSALTSFTSKAARTGSCGHCAGADSGHRGLTHTAAGAIIAGLLTTVARTPPSHQRPERKSGTGCCPASSADAGNAPSGSPPASAPSSSERSQRSRSPTRPSRPGGGSASPSPGAASRTASVTPSPTRRSRCGGRSISAAAAGRRSAPHAGCGSGPGPALRRSLSPSWLR
jgi:hypothetical protein